MKFKDKKDKSYLLFLRPLEKRIMLDGAFGDVLNPDAPGVYEGGSFQDTVRNDTGQDMSVGDYNGDGLDDLLILNQDGIGDSWLIFGDSDRSNWGDMTQADLDASNSVHFTGDVVDKQLKVSFLGDINGDGYEDIGFSNYSGGDGSVVVVWSTPIFRSSL